MRNLLSKLTLISLFLGTFIGICLSAPSARAATDRQPFVGFGIGLQFYSQDTSGSGFYYQGFAGYKATDLLGFGMHIGSAYDGIVHVRSTDFGGFGQILDATSGLFGRLYLDGIYATVDGGGNSHGVNSSQVGFGPGVGAGMFIPTGGALRLTPELTYHAALLNSVVHLVNATFSLTWDL